MDSTLMNAWSEGADRNEPATPFQDESFRHDMNRWGTRRCELGMGQAQPADDFGCGLIIDEHAPEPFRTWSPSNPVDRRDPGAQTNDFSERSATMRPAPNDFPQKDVVRADRPSHRIPSERHEAIHSNDALPSDPATHQPEPFRPGHRQVLDRDIPIPNEKHNPHSRDSFDHFPAPSVNISDHLYRTPVDKVQPGKPSEITIPSDSERTPGDVDSNFFKGDRFSNFVGKDRCSVTTSGDKHWDVLKGADGKTTYARIQEPLPDGSGYRVTEYRSPFRDSQLLGSCYEVDNEGRVKRSSVETLQLDASLRLAKKNLSASVDINGNLSVSVPGAGRIEDMTRTYYRNGTEMDKFVDSSRASQPLSVSAKFRTDESGQRETGMQRGQASPTEMPYMVITSPLTDKASAPDSNDRSVYMYDSFENNYYCTQGPDTGNRYEISVRNRLLIRNQRPAPSRCRH
jgi:hypothetical protein